MNKNGNPRVVKEICPKCGKEFLCSKSAKCWCYELDIPVETLDLLQQDFESCICPECLKSYSR
jgi:hypothetical protein